MNQKRLLLWLGLLAVILVVRWIDPLGATKSVQAVSEPIAREPVERVESVESTSTSKAHTHWPLRHIPQDTNPGNAFMTRNEVAQFAAKRHVVSTPPPPLQPAFVAPLPPPSIVPQPPLQVIGTWGEANNLAVFLSGPQGTVLAHPGDVLLSQYRVKSITKQEVTLLQDSNQRTWSLAIPAAPSTLQTWPGR
jgi:hypothetical protein